MVGNPDADPDRLERLLILPDIQMSAGLRQMDASGDKTLIVVDEQRRLLGIVTDGDVRRWVIAGKGLDRPVSEAMNPEPVVLGVPAELDEARAVMTRTGISCIPVVDGARRVVSAIRWVDLFEVQPVELPQLGVPVVIMAGGEGSRLAPYTKVLPKPLIPVGDTPIVELIIDRFVSYGCRKIHLAVNYKANLIKAYFADVAHDYEVVFVEEPEPLGTAGALALLEGVIGSTFFVSNCDVLIDADFSDVLEFHRASGNRLTLVGSMKHFTVPYGVIDTAAGGQVVSISEKPGYDYLVSTGMYVMEPEVLADIPKGRPYHVTDLASDYLASGVRVGVYPVADSAWMDMGQFEELADMRARLGFQ